MQKRNAERYQQRCKAAGLVLSHYTTSVVGGRLTFDLDSRNHSTPLVLHAPRRPVWQLANIVDSECHVL